MRFNPNAQGPTAEVSAAEAEEFITPALSKSTQHAQKMAALNQEEALPVGEDGKTTKLEYARRRHQGLCFYCGKHDATEQCRILTRKNAAAALKASKAAGGEGAAPAPAQAEKRDNRN
ncbi:hypothetical protein CB0940_08382 [Cercospora beticola]|uniref:Uncharacterized protein n=1 Tax=Cercospora beticola TaxID=122368 RepID=A0A2G5HNM2_CERBT|nr:hypothetical protein CB0940_08382 [Cercospora beticola]PIA94151.1 hypothetical protein CB0940_08382 [Cercospora beticola]WPB04959.1 hypothetical protein RHO25_009607 [Cercospora beticola]